MPSFVVVAACCLTFIRSSGWPAKTRNMPVWWWCDARSGNAAGARGGQQRTTNTTRQEALQCGRRCAQQNASCQRPTRAGRHARAAASIRTFFAHDCVRCLRMRLQSLRIAHAEVKTKQTTRVATVCASHAAQYATWDVNERTKYLKGARNGGHAHPRVGHVSIRGLSEWSMAAYAAEPLRLTPEGEIAGIVARVRAAFRAGKSRPLAWRKAQLNGIKRLLLENETSIAVSVHSSLAVVVRVHSFVCAADVGGLYRVCRRALVACAAAHCHWIRCHGCSCLERRVVLLAHCG